MIRALKALTWEYLSRTMIWGLAAACYLVVGPWAFGLMVGINADTVGDLDVSQTFFSQLCCSCPVLFLAVFCGHPSGEWLRVHDGCRCRLRF